MLRAQQRFRIWVAGRRSGKTFVAGAYLSEGATNLEPGINGYIAPTYKMAKRIAWNEIVHMVPKNRVDKISDGDLTITFKPNPKYPDAKEPPRIMLFGSDNPDSLRGMGMRRFVLDEYADQDARVWPEIIRPMIAQTRGDGMFIGTPKGFNHFHELYQRALENIRRWYTQQTTSLEGGLIPPKELEEMRSEMSERQFKQEMEASFETLSARVYYAFSRYHNVSDEIVNDPMLDVYVGIDFNIVPGMHAVVGHKVADQLHIFDEVYIPNGNTEELSREVLRRHGVVKVNGLLRKRKLIAFPDPTGKARHTNAPIGVTDHTILASYGFDVRTPYAPYALEDKHNTVNTALRTASGVCRIFIHPRCRKLINALEGFTYKEETGLPDKSANLDHISDALAYLVCVEMPMEANVLLNEGLPY